MKAIIFDIVQSALMGNQMGKKIILSNVNIEYCAKYRNNSLHFKSLSVYIFLIFYLNTQY
jgi:hypothetical protein